MEKSYGSFVKVPDDSGAFVTMFAGLSKDISLLPTDVPTWTKAYCIDTTDLYIFESTSGKWWKQ